MKKKVSVSVITPFHNSENFLNTAIKSVNGQTMTDLEMLLINDCSTDKSKEIAREWCQNDKRIKLFQTDEHSGPAVARNVGIEQAAGRYIAFLDSDDIWVATKLEKQLRYMETNKYAFTHTFYEKITEQGTRTGKVVRPPVRMSYSDMLKSNRIGCLSVIYDSEILGKVYMPDVPKRQDYGLWLRLLKLVPYAYCLREMLAMYRVRSASTSSNKLAMVHHNWYLYRYIEQFSRCRSAYYVTWNIIRKLKDAR